MAWLTIVEPVLGKMTPCAGIANKQALARSLDRNVLRTPYLVHHSW